MISEKFTIDDIHQVRYESYESRKNMSAKELIEDTKKGAQEGKKILEQIRNKKEH